LWRLGWEGVKWVMRVWVEDARVGRTLLSDAFDAEFSIVPETMQWILALAPVAFAFP
jgi:hypothetical protein